MNTQTRTLKIGRLTLLALLVGSLFLISAVPAFAERPQRPEPAPGEGPVVKTLEHVEEALKNLEAELASMTAPVAERLEERVEEVVEVLGAVLGRIGDKEINPEDAAIQKKIVELTLRLHRLIYQLDEMVENAPRTGAPQPGLRILARFVERLEDLAFKLDGFILAKAAKP